MLDKLGFVKPSYDNEKRVALLPVDVKNIRREIWVETGFGDTLSIPDSEYEKQGVTIKSREEIFAQCKSVFCLKLLQPRDYDMIQPDTNIVGWVHPYGSGSSFMKEQAIPKDLFVFDTDGKNPTLFYQDKNVPMGDVKKNFLFENSYMAGKASVLHALLSFGFLPTKNDKIAILSPGNVSQGAFSVLSQLGTNPRIFYRTTMHEFIDEISEFDIIVNGIETDGSYIIDKNAVQNIKKGALVIDAAADTGNVIYGTRFTTHEKPIYEVKGVYYYCINNSPSLLHRSISKELSRIFTDHIYNLAFEELRKDII